MITNTDKNHIGVFSKTADVSTNQKGLYEINLYSDLRYFMLFLSVMRANSRSTNGLISWVNSDGVELKKLQDIAQ